MISRRLSLLVGAFALAPASASAAVWGSFDATRVNYAGGVVSNGTEYDELRTLVTNNGDSLAASTPTLTANYLSGVDVFYTSLLNTGAMVLSMDEQTALANWVNGGGTLLVSGDIFPLPFYESFTNQWGIANWVNTMGASASPLVDHPLTAGVTTIAVNTASTFTYGDDAVELYQADDGNAFMIVLEPPDFCNGGRILVFGDHNLFTDGGILSFDNLIAAQNIVEWAAAAPALGCDCGNGVLDPGEVCDDGNASSSDACPASCQPAACGDGYVYVGFEDCDDGDDDDTDACTSACEVATCGDGFVQAGVEACDDANGVDTDACPGACELAACGDGYVFAGFEECDDGNAMDGDGCTALCDLEGGESSDGSSSGGESTESSSDGTDDGASAETGASSDSGTGGTTTDTPTTGGPTGDDVGDASADDSTSGTATATEGSEAGPATGDSSGGSNGDAAGSDDGGGCGCDLDRRDTPGTAIGGLVLIVLCGVTRPRSRRVSR